MKFHAQLPSLLPLFLSLLLLAPACANADISIDEHLQQANVAYSSARYEEAISAYRAILAKRGLSSEILYNLGNSYAQNNQSGLAILQYLRGLQLSPEDSDMQGNLELIRKNIGLFEDIPTFSQRIFTLLDMNQWALAALIAFILFTLILLLDLRLQKKKIKIVSCLFLSIFIVLCCVSSYQQRLLWKGAIITAADVRLLMSPFDSATSLGAIQEGSLVVIEKQHSGFHFVTDSKKRSGWIPVSSVETINTSSSSYSQSAPDE